MKGAFAFVVFALTTFARAQDQASLTARLHETARNSSIDVAGITPWHLKLDVQLFDAKGKPTDQGTIEEFWASPKLRRVTYTLGSYKGVQLQNNDGSFQLKGQEYEPAILDELLDQVVDPMPHEEEIDQSKPDLRKQKFGKTELECIMLDQPLKGIAYPPLGLFPTYCLDVGQNTLRLSTELGSITFVRNRMGTFQGHSVAIDTDAASNGVSVAKAHVSALSGASFTDTDFKPTEDMEPVSANIARIGSDVMAGMALSKVPPVYPAEAKLNHVSGSVVLSAIIGRDGHIRSLHVRSTGDANLAMAAIAAVRKWTYKPYLLNGQPTEVETTITVNFSLS